MNDIFTKVDLRYLKLCLVAFQYYVIKKSDATETLLFCLQEWTAVSQHGHRRKCVLSQTWWKLQGDHPYIKENLSEKHSSPYLMALIMSESGAISEATCLF